VAGFTPVRLVLAESNSAQLWYSRLRGVYRIFDWRGQLSAQNAGSLFKYSPS